MKTGRVRKKVESSPSPKPEPTSAPKPSPKPAPKPATPKPYSGPRGSAAPQKVRSGRLPMIMLLSLFGCFALTMITFTILGGGRAKQWVAVERVAGEWTTTVRVLGPQVTSDERWADDCQPAPGVEATAEVRTNTCIEKETQTNREAVVDEYEEYAYNIHFEETYSQVYEAQGNEFVVTQLGQDDWWEGEYHYRLEEELDRESCDYTTYTVWVDDPEDSTLEIEVYLAECEVWDHVTVSERVYDQKLWCQCDMTTLVEVDRLQEKGAGASVRWPRPLVPAGGRTERSFEGQVTFWGDDHSYDAQTDDPERYRDYMTDRYYLGLRDGKAVTVSKNPGK